MIDLRGWAARHRWFLAATLAIFGGYLLGKDMALRDNARDAQSRETRTR